MNLTRRRVLAGLLSSVGLGWPWPSPSRSRDSPQVVIVGGGFAGGACATWLSRLLPTARIVIVDRQAEHLSGYFCNAVLAGQMPEAVLRHPLSGLARGGIRTVQGEVVGVDRGRRQVRLQGGGRLSYDYLVLALGIAHRADAVEGASARALQAHPPAWPGTLGELRQVAARLRALPQGGVLAMVPPPLPYRCPPGPYERASLFADWLARHNPRAKILLFDPKDRFSKDALFFEAWAAAHPGRIEWIGRPQGGQVQALDLDRGRLRLASGETVQSDWVHYLPPQQAPSLVANLGWASPDGWLEVNPADFRLWPDEPIHAIGDAVQLSPMPKSAFAAQQQARHCAAVIAADHAGRPPPAPWLANVCFSHVGADRAFSVSARYTLSDGRLAVADHSERLSPLGADDTVRRHESQAAQWLYRHLCQTAFNTAETLA